MWKWEIGLIFLVEKKWWSCRSTDVTKLLQRQRRDSQCNGVCRILSTGKTSVHLSRNPQGRKFGGITPSQSPSKIWRAAAVEKYATRRLISWIILASVVNASSRRRRRLLLLLLFTVKLDDHQKCSQYMHNTRQLLISLYLIHFTPFDAHYCHMGTAIKHPVPDRVNPSCVFFDIRALWRSGPSVRVPGCQKLQKTA